MDKMDKMDKVDRGDKVGLGEGGFAGLWLSPLPVVGSKGREDAEFACQRGVMEALHLGVCLQGDGEIAGSGVAGADLLT